MRILRIEYRNIGLFDNNFILDFIAKDKVIKEQGDAYIYYKDFATLNTVSFFGANASGKTSALHLINFAFDIVLKQQSLSNISIPSGLIMNNSELIVDFFYEKYYRLHSKFSVEDSFDSEEQVSYKFLEETLYSKSKSVPTKKENICKFNESHILSKRTSLQKKFALLDFLREDDSILLYTKELRELKNKKSIFSLINENMLNYYRLSGNAAIKDINVFDDSIDILEADSSQIKVKFKNKENMLSCSKMPNKDYLLSSGTAKGGNVLYYVKRTLQTGGYMLIDEIENHFHKLLVQFIIDLFNDNELNLKGATLIFTTHYAEVLDSIDRKDNIFITTRNKEYVSTIIKYSDVIKRNENKKSRVILSNLIKGTSPSYESIQAFKESIWD